MDNMINDALDKGLITIERRPRSEELANLIRSTSSYSGNVWGWLDWIRLNNN
jgi:capsid protein